MGEDENLQKDMKKQEEQDASKKALKTGAKAAANAYLGPAGGKAVDLASKTKLGDNILNKGAESINKKAPKIGKIANAANKSGALDAADKAVDATSGGVDSLGKDGLPPKEGLIDKSNNIDGNIIHINHAAKTLLNIQENEKFESIFEKFNVDINMEKIIYLENWTSSEKKINVNEKTINLFFAPFKNENERPAGVIVVIQDITEHVKLDSMRKEFVADVSHELKTPITSIMGYADTILENDLDEETQKNFLKRISSEAQRMSNLVYDLLTLSRYDSSKVRIEKTEFDLGELVKYTFDGLKLEMEKKSIIGECFVTSNVPLVYADKSGIQRVIINILTNAIKYTKENGNVKAYVGFVYNDAYIKIIDTGIGISKEDLERIFDRFYRVDKSRTREMGGTGLGLSIAKEILDKNDGRIDIKSELGKGTEVVIRIPTKQGLEKYNKDENKE